MKILKWTAGFFLCVSLAHADYGCHFVINSKMSYALDDPQKKISFRFTCRDDMNLIAASFYCGDAKIPPAYQVSLQEDRQGFPSSEPLEKAGVTPARGWNTVPLNNVPLFAGRVYHLVLEQDLTRGGHHPVGIIGPENFAAVAYTDILNPFYPNDEKPDRALDVLLFEKGKWRETGRNPLFALHGSGYQFQGNPYDDFREKPIHGNGTPEDPSDDVLQGAAIHPHCGFFPKGLAVRLRKNGNPTAPLNYRVYVIDYLHHKTSPAFSGEALKPRQVSTAFQWVTIGFKEKDKPQAFPPECRYVVFQSDSGHAVPDAPGCQDCYLLSDVGNSGSLAGAADMSFDGGAHLSRAAYSLDGGATWIDEFERDSNVVILGPDCTSILSGPESAPNPIPTPPSWFKVLAP